MAGTGTGGGGGNVCGMLLQGVLEGVVQKMTQKTGPSPDAPKKDAAKESEAKPEQNPQQQSAPPMSGVMHQLLATLSAKMQGPAIAQQAPTSAGTKQGQADQPSTSAPHGQQTQQSTPQGDAEQRTLLRRILDGLSQKVAAPMDFARRGFEKLTTAVDRPDELISRGRERGGFGGRMEAATGGVIKGLGRDRELQGVGDVAGAAGDAAGGIPVVGKPTQSFFKLNEVLLKSIDRLRVWGDRLHEGNIRFAEFSGQMFAVAKEQEARDIQLSQKKGEELAASARFQAEQKSRLDNQLMTIENFWKNAENYVDGFLKKWAADLIKMTPLGREELEEGGQGMLDWMRDLEEMESKREGSLIPPPKRWGPG